MRQIAKIIRLCYSTAFHQSLLKTKLHHKPLLKPGAYFSFTVCWETVGSADQVQVWVSHPSWLSSIWKQYSVFLIGSCRSSRGQYVHAKSLQLCLTLWDPMECSPPGSSVHGILQARILEWVAIPSFRELSPPRDQTTSLLSPALANWVFFFLPLVPPAEPSRKQSWPVKLLLRWHFLKSVSQNKSYGQAPSQQGREYPGRGEQILAK